MDHISEMLLQLIVMIGLDIVYCVTGGKAMQYVFDVRLLTENCCTKLLNFNLKETKFHQFLEY